MNDLHEWLQKNNLCPENILYLYRSDRKTVVHRMDGEEAALYAPLHSVLSVLPEDLFLNISNDGIYTMSDGRTFQGRKRGMSDHRRLRAEIGLADTQPRRMSMSLLEKCSLLDDMPLAFCVIELVFNEAGHGVDFIFRYCNAEMANIEGVPVEEMLDRSFYEVFPNGDKKWLVSYADVALNGTKHTLHDYSPEVDKYLTIHCYQPEPGYCACVLQTIDP